MAQKAFQELDAKNWRKVTASRMPLAVWRGCGNRSESLPDSWCVHRAVGDGLVQVDIAVADLDVESAVRAAAYPGFVMNRCALTSKVRQREQTSL